MSYGGVCSVGIAAGGSRRVTRGRGSGERGEACPLGVRFGSVAFTRFGPWSGSACVQGTPCAHHSLTTARVGPYGQRARAATAC